ncbi:MAG TPA: TetR/AcrR family transcriptional regulator [Opitutaceae bacterium]|nr:TetR/AcrR family transcriptional regulator [Opitutaceae bacterium]
MPLAPENIFDDEPAPIARLLTAAANQLFTVGYQALTMDELAHELGVSKKTLYIHFPGKDAIVGRIIDAIGLAVRTRMEEVLANPALSYTEKAAGVIDVAGTTFGRANPAMLRDLQRYAPQLYQKIEDIRSKIVPLVFGRLIRMGIAEGKVRSDIDPAFATEFWLQAIRGLVQPVVLDRTQRTLAQTLKDAHDLFFAGLLTSAGRKDYEKHS